MPAAGQDLKKLLVKLGINTSDWKQAVREIRSELTSLNNDAKKQYEQQKLKIAEQKAYQQQALTQQKEIQASAKEEVALKAAAVAQEKLLQAQARTRVESERAITAELQKQKVALQLQASQAAAAAKQAAAQARAGGGGGGQGGGGGVGGLFSVLMGGSKFGGSIAGGVAVGTLFAQGIQLAIDKLYEFGQKIAEFAAHDGPILEDVRNNFLNLAQGRGFDGENFIDKLRKSTMNMVPDLDLLRMGNAALQSSLKLTEDQVTQLVHATITLADANGHDAQQAVQALNRAFITGRFQMLGYLTGITRAEMQTKNFGAAMSTAQRQQQSFNDMVDLMNKKLGAVGEMTLDLEDKLRVFSVERGRFFESTYRSLVTTEGFNDFLGLVDRILKWLSEGEDKGKAFGQTLGAVFEALTVYADELKNSLDAVGTAAGAAMDALFGSKTQSQTRAQFENLADLKVWALSFVSLLEHIKLGADVLGLSLLYLGKIMVTNFKDIPKVWREYQDEIMRVSHESETKMFDTARKMGLADKLQSQGIINKDDYNRYLSENKTRITAEEAAAKATGGGGKGKGLFGGGEDAESIQQARKLAKLRLEALQAAQQQEYEIVKLGIQMRQEVLEEEYKSGEMSLEEYIMKRIALRQEELQAQLKMNAEEKKAQLQLLNIQLANQDITPAEAAIRRKMIEAQFGYKDTTAKTQAERETSGLSMQLTQDQRKATQLRNQIALEVQQKGLTDEEKATEDSFKNREMSADDYLAKMNELFDKELEVFRQMEQAKYDSSEKTGVARVQMEKAVADKTADIQNKKNQLDRTIDDQRIRNLDDSYKKRMSTLDLQRGAINSGGGLAAVFFGMGGTGDQNALVQKQIDITYQYISELEQMRSTVQANTKDWDDWTQKIVQAQQEIIKLSAEMKSNSEVATGMFDYLSRAFQGVGKYSATATLFSGMANFFQGQADFQKLARQKGIGTYSTTYASANIGQGMSVNQPVTTFTAARDPITAFAISFKALVSDVKNGGKNFTTNLDKFATSLGGVVQQMQGYVNAFTQPIGGAAGATAGIGAGASIGSEATGIMKDLGGSLGKIGSALGPWGEIGGAVIGGILGGIFGAKRKETENIARRIQNEFNKIVMALNVQQTTLASAITQLQSQRDQAVQQLSGRKGGQDTLNQMLPQMDQQINQLKAQQTQLIHDMNAQVAVLSAPVGFQDLLTSLDSVLQKYKQYKDAASSATDLANANKFLALSLQQLQTQNQETLLTDYSSAVQDAIQLQDLALQYQQAQEQYTTQVYDLMSGGVLTRERTFAQTKLQQLAALKQQHDLQMADMKEQLDAADYKVRAESKIFSLATTRIGLETQLLALQDQQTSNDMLRISALQALVAQMSDPNFLKTISAVPGLSGGVTNDVGMLLAILQQLGLTSAPAPSAPKPSGGGSSSALENAAGSLYGVRGRYGQNGFSREYL